MVGGEGVKLLVTGSEGVLGRYLVPYLRKRGYEVVTLDVAGGADYRDDIVYGDLYVLLDEVRPDVVVHLAAFAEPRESLRLADIDVRVNILGTIRLMKAMLNTGVKKLVFTSSCAIYGDLYAKVKRPLKEVDDTWALPVSVYGVSKLAAEKYIEYFRRIGGLDYVVLRLGNVYSPFDNKYIFRRLYESRDRFIMYRNGYETRDYVWVGDFARAVENAVEYVASGGSVVANIGHEELYTWQIVDMWRRKFGYPKVVEKQKKGRVGDISRMKLDTTVAETVLGWEPRMRVVDALEYLYDGFGGGSKWRETL